MDIPGQYVNNRRRVMAKIDSHTDAVPRREPTGARAAEEQLADLLKDVAKDRVRVEELSRLDLRQLNDSGKAQVMRMLATELKGQLPQQLAQSLMAGNLGVDQLEQLLTRFANAHSGNLDNRFSRAASPDAARELATDKSVPQQALRWTQFVQRVLHVPGARVRDRAGVASPKGEGSSLLELLGQPGAAKGGASLRTPKLVERSIQDLSPGQRAFLMKGTFGEQLAEELLHLGIKDPLQFVRAGALPDARAQLADDLGMPRARLLGLLLRAEMLKIGAGRNGELGLRPELLAPLRGAGIAMLGSLAIVKALSREEMAYIYLLLRKGSGGFAKAVKGGRLPVKRDLLHWSRVASRRPSEILLADVDERGPRFSRMDAQELCQAWYMENLFWEALANSRRHKDDIEALLRQREEEEQQRRRGRDQERNDDTEDTPEWVEDSEAELEYDEQRDDNLMCFWITDFNADPTLPLSMRRMYVCVDPQSGAIIPQHIDADHRQPT
jgi:hypothetical protein